LTRYVDGRPPEVAGLPGAHHGSYTQTPNLRALREGKGITLEQAAEILKDQRHGRGILRTLEAGEPVPRIIAARVCGALGVNYAQAKGEI
jgi:hypothetical protein